MIRANIKKEFNCNVERLWDIVTNNKDYSWRSDVAKIKILDDNHFVEFTKSNYPTYFTITDKVALKEYRFRIRNTNIRGNWIGLFQSLDNGNTLLDFIEEINVENVFMRLLAKPFLKTQQDKYIKDLENKILSENIKNSN